jgi:hypothetical protein
VVEDMARNGHTLRSIATRVGRTPKAVHAVIAKPGLTTRGRGDNKLLPARMPPDAYERLEEMARERGLLVTEFSRIMQTLASKNKAWVNVLFDDSIEHIEANEKPLVTAAARALSDARATARKQLELLRAGKVEPPSAPLSLSSLSPLLDGRVGVIEKAAP